MLVEAHLGSHNAAFCDNVPMTMTQWLATVPSFVTDGPEKKEQPNKNSVAEAVHDHPWVSDFLGATKRTASWVAHCVAQDEDGDVDEEADAEPLDKVAEAAWAAVSQSAAGDVCSESTGNEFFYRCRTAGRGDVGYDEVHTEPRRGNARLFCKQYMLVQSRVFSCHKYGDCNAVQLALEV